MQNRNTKALRKLGNLVRNYVDTEGDFKFIEPADVRFAFSSNNKIVCLIKKDNIVSAIPEDEFKQWFDDMSDKIFAAYDRNTNVRLVSDGIAFNVCPTAEFVKLKDDKEFLEDTGAFAAAVLETIDGAVIDDWGDDGEEVDSPYYV